MGIKPTCRPDPLWLVLQENLGSALPKNHPGMTQSPVSASRLLHSASPTSPIPTIRFQSKGKWDHHSYIRPEILPRRRPARRPNP